MNHVAQVLDLIRSGLNPGQPHGAHGLMLVPLFGGAPAKEYLTADEAFGAGLLSITEIGSGSVPEVAAVNSAEVPILLLDGEHIEGAMQNRVLNSTVLIAAGQKTILPVSCVEHGRWDQNDGNQFAPSDDIAYSRLRSKNAVSAARSARREGSRRVDQGEVWEDVALKQQERSVGYSPTGAMRDAYDDSRDEIDKMIAKFTAPQPGQTGTIACMSGACVALDAFDRPETLSKLWPRLLRGYAMDALGSTAADLPEGAVQRFLDEAASGQSTSHAGVGLGIDVMLTASNAVGHALTWDEGIVHLALFARNQERNRGGRDGGIIDSPLQRRRLI
jgi:ARG and Rhodanese-Phosphatase-superfamily-associated Protein domain